MAFITLRFATVDRASISHGFWEHDPEDTAVPLSCLVQYGSYDIALKEICRSGFEVYTLGLAVITLPGRKSKFYTASCSCVGAQYELAQITSMHGVYGSRR